jgi:diguanylate cyclase (GGDEF)-like protein
MGYRQLVTILYVEDDELVREGYALALKRIAKRLYTASNGEEGLELYRHHQPDIVISDINMPRMNGIEMVKAIKAFDEQANIIFTTAHSESQYLIEAINLQVEGYLIKPVAKKALFKLIEKLTSLIEIRRENEQQRQILQSIIDARSSKSIVIRNDCTLLFANQSFLEFFGLQSVDAFNNKFQSIFDIFHNDVAFLEKKKILQATQENGNLYQLLESIDDLERVAILKDHKGKQKSFYINQSKINDNTYVLHLTDITKLAQDRELTIKKAYTDGLTGIYNRNKFEEVLKYELTKVKRHNHEISIALFDIDHFKAFNDKYGHLIGDEILISIAYDIDKHIRDADLFARWGGEEFVVLLNDTPFKQALEIANRFRELIANIQHKKAGGVSASFGVTQINPKDTIESIFKRADDAMYQAKLHGRNRVKGIE